MFKILIKEEDKRDATAVYLEIIEDAIGLLGEEVTYIFNPDEINNGDKVFTVTVNMFLKAWKTGKSKFICNWFQGIIPEEAELWENTSRISKWLNKQYYTFCEKYVLKRSALNLFVSNAMQDHYRTKYSYNKDNFFVMPCFNLSLQENAFYDEKYSKPTFLYAGGLTGWQCFESMVELFANIKKHLKDAALCIYTGDQEEARKILNKHNVDAEMKYVTYDKLSEEIKKFKYGFMIREENEVNRVATPTKMNSYLANGIIPIYSDVIGAYKEYLFDLKYSIPLESKTHEGIKKIFELEKQVIHGSEVMDEYRKVFTAFYNRDIYVQQISKALKTELSKL